MFGSNGRCQILCGGFCQPKGYPPATAVDIFLPKKLVNFNSLTGAKMVFLPLIMFKRDQIGLRIGEKVTKLWKRAKNSVFVSKNFCGIYFRVFGG